VVGDVTTYADSGRASDTNYLQGEIPGEILPKQRQTREGGRNPHFSVGGT